ncbi:hypothetical protein V5085_03735 [Moellerella wisconsensis]|uniref:hypothetical protein n=1 Tax=Morganellaceae TaxID=1903414 RepID=UPI000BC7023E|nr:hypothetical protein [Providencia rettgeri]PCQ36717.1 hypothetical protein CQA26_17205 [Providencia rettgeri]
MNRKHLIPLRKLNDELETFAKALPNFETVKDVRQERELRIKKLTRYLSKKSQKLMNKLKNCHPEYSCGSAACPECVRKHRLEMTKAVMTICSNLDEWKSVTLIFYQDAISNDGYWDFDLNKLKRRLRRWLNDCGFSKMVIGGYEMDFHTDVQKWLPHFHLIVPNEPDPISKLRLKMKSQQNAVFRADIINRPILVNNLKIPEKQISYHFKSIWWRIESISYDEKIEIGLKVRKRKRRTKKFRLKKKEYIQSLVMLDEIGISELTFMYKVKKYGSHLVIKD